MQKCSAPQWYQKTAARLEIMKIGTYDKHIIIQNNIILQNC